jgi:hypothetical protein
MDSTEEVAPVGLLMDSLRDKQALAVPRDKTAYLERTPADAPSPRLIRVQVDGKLSSQGLFTGHIMQTIDGDVGILYRTAFRRIPQSQWKEALQGVAGSEGYAGEVSNPQVSDVEQIDKPFQFSYDYTREKYYQWDDKVPSHWISPPLPAMGGEIRRSRSGFPRRDRVQRHHPIARGLDDGSAQGCRSQRRLARVSREI